MLQQESQLDNTGMSPSKNYILLFYQVRGKLEIWSFGLKNYCHNGPHMNFKIIIIIIKNKTADNRNKNKRRRKKAGAQKMNESDGIQSKLNIFSKYLLSSLLSYSHLLYNY
jgi:hypothetical protein